MIRFFRSLWFVSTCALLGCSPKFDWREVRGVNAPYSVMLPAKPSSQTRQINLDGTPVTMTMTATRVDDITFAIGSAELADDSTARKSLAAMKTALVRNIGGTISHEASSLPGAVPATMEIEAHGRPDAGTGREPRLLAARLIAKDRHIYQLVVTGRESAVTHDAVDTFFESFKPD